MQMRLRARAGLVAGTIALSIACASSLAQSQTLTLRFGVLAGLTGDPAPSGQAWNESAKLAIEHVKATLVRLNMTDVQVILSDSQDSQGSPKSGVEGAQKLVQIDKVNVIVGDFYSSVTSAVATAVTIQIGRAHV